MSLNLTGQIYLRRAAEGADCEAEAEVAALRAQGQREGGERGKCVAFRKLNSVVKRGEEGFRLQGSDSCLVFVKRGAVKMSGSSDPFYLWRRLALLVYLSYMRNTYSTYLLWS